MERTGSQTAPWTRKVKNVVFRDWNNGENRLIEPCTFNLSILNVPIYSPTTTRKVKNVVALRDQNTGENRLIDSIMDQEGEKC